MASIRILSVTQATSRPLPPMSYSPSKFSFEKKLRRIEAASSRACCRIICLAEQSDASVDNEAPVQLEAVPDGATIEKELQKAVRKTAATFAPRASSLPKSKNPAFPGSTLYKVFEVQAYVSMVLGGLLSYNVLFPSNEPDIWRLMGMWSIWMFTIPSLRARDCSSNEKDALNYLFLLVPLINVTLPIVWKSFPAVWTADVLAFSAMYAWKMEWFGGTKEN